ncbi:YbaB/EbfC family nucleoid-associated protein [Actinophytocola glycyrrhizae]|uniref:YbaB/EbfC family nucleoid-associated protein n=1 Tax=Actinophytocola glycyrrhizae TaxID=2044873 RepID=A0ABV9RXT1_9PSEU
MEIDIDHELAAVDRNVAQAGERAQEQVARVGRVTGKASSPDGGIEVEVAPGGLLTGLRLSPGAVSGDMETLARNITSLADRATRRAGSNMYKTLAPVLGERGEKHLESLGYVPVDDDEDAAEVDFSDPLKHRGSRR